MKDENLLVIILAMLLFCALFAYINNDSHDSHKTTWKGIDSLYTQGELLEHMIQRLENKTIVVHDTVKVHDTIYVNVPNID